jgi:hypothetical protein
MNVLFFLWLLTGYAVQITIAYVLVVFSKDADTVEYSQVWEEFTKLDLIGHVRNSIENQIVWDEFYDNFK